MLLVDGFAQNYRWGMEQILALTMPQIVMLSAAGRVSRQRLDARLAQRHPGSSSSSHRSAPASSSMPMFNGKRIDQLNSAEYMLYHRMGDT